MSCTACSAIATCKVSGFDSSETAALAIYAYLVNHPDEIPEALDYDDEDSDSAVEKIESYLSLDGENLSISYDSESDFMNHDSELFDFLCSHFACLQTSLYMEVTWSRAAGGTSYYDRQGKQIDIHALLTAHLQ